MCSEGVRAPFGVHGPNINPFLRLGDLAGGVVLDIDIPRTLTQGVNIKVLWQDNEWCKPNGFTSMCSKSRRRGACVLYANDAIITN